MSLARIADIRDYLPIAASEGSRAATREVLPPEVLAPATATAIFGAGVGAGVLLAVMALVAAAMF